MLRAFTLFDLLLSQPLRWLCGASAQLTGWSIFSAGGTFELAEKAFIAIAADGRALLDPNLDIFEPIARTQPAFAAWRLERQAATIASPDGTRHHTFQLVLNEARSPATEANIAATNTTVVLIQVMAEAALAKMYDPKLALASWLSSQGGKNALATNAERHELTIGAHTTDDTCESNYGCFDYVLSRFLNISVESCSGIALQLRMGHFDRVSQIVSDRRHGKSAAPDQDLGYFYAQDEAVQESIVECARKLRKSARVEARADHAEQLEYKARKREQARPPPPPTLPTPLPASDYPAFPPPPPPFSPSPSPPACRTSRRRSTTRSPCTSAA